MSALWSCRLCRNVDVVAFLRVSYIMTLAVICSIHAGTISDRGQVGCLEIVREILVMEKTFSSSLWPSQTPTTGIGRGSPRWKSDN
jgi:hypothetical protein